MRGILGKALVRDLDVQENLGLQYKLLVAFIYLFSIILSKVNVFIAHNLVSLIDSQLSMYIEN